MLRRSGTHTPVCVPDPYCAQFRGELQRGLPFSREALEHVGHGEIRQTELTFNTRGRAFLLALSLQRHEWRCGPHNLLFRVVPFVR